MSLRERIEALVAHEREAFDDADRALFAEFRTALARGEIRAAERTPDGAWCVNVWVKQGILLGFRMGALADMSAHPSLRFFDKDTYPVRPTTLADKIRIVPGHNKPLDVRACKVGYGYRKGDTKMRDYVDGFIAKMRSSGKLDALITQYMKPDQIKAAN